MKSPKSDTVDSSIYTYISSLSPTKPVKVVAPVAQGFPGLNSGPLVFTSPQINPPHSSVLQRHRHCLSSSGLEPCSEKRCDANLSPKQCDGLMASKELAEELDRRDDITKEGCQANVPFNEKHAEADGKREGDDEQNNEHPVTEIAGAGNTGHLLPESVQVMQKYGDCGETNGAVSRELVESIMLYNSKANQHQSGMRRHLQFEEADHKIEVREPDSWNPLSSVHCSTTASPANSEVQESSGLNIPSTPCNRQLAIATRPVFSSFSPKNNGNSSLTVSKPFGVGLHLNSICSGIATIKSSERGYLSIQEKKPSLENINSCSDPSLVENTSLRSEDGRNENLVSFVGSSAISPSPDSVKSLNNPLLFEKLCNKRKFSSEGAERAELFNQSNVQKKRRKTSGTSDGDGCKLCNCKKTKCLKLYCDCFAAGIYCDDTCSCQGCFNRPEYEDTVLETRQQIESRNPLAFVPKIIQRLTDPPANRIREDENHLAPTSARHKRGCNCKKSMCSKKYCECYQANVGCSDGCRCEGCKNIYGTKDEYGTSKDIISTDAISEKLETSYNEQLEKMAVTGVDFLQNNLLNPQNLTPSTPSFQCSDHGEDALKMRFPYGRYLPSPDSDLTFLDGIAFHRELEYGSSEQVDEFSQSFHHVLDNKDSHTPPMALASLVSPNDPRSQLCHLSDRLISSNSPSWINSPIAPTNLFSGAKHHDPKDDVPEILKEASTPQNAVKVSSPNKKRVSPPHSRLLHFGGSPSGGGGLRSGRKFILRAVPSSSPCINSKGCTDKSTNDP